MNQWQETMFNNVTWILNLKYENRFIVGKCSVGFSFAHEGKV